MVGDEIEIEGEWSRVLMGLLENVQFVMKEGVVYKQSAKSF